MTACIRQQRKALLPEILFMTGAKGKQTSKKGSSSQVAKMWNKAPPKSQKQASASQAAKKPKVEAKEPTKVDFHASYKML